MRLPMLSGRVVLASAGVVAATTTCRISDVLRSPGLQDVSLSFTSDSVLVVSAPIRPAVGVTVNGTAYTQARVRLTSSDTGVVAVHGDTLVPRRRGGATLTIALESSALPRDPPTLTQPLVVVADTVTLDSAAVRFTSLGDSVTLAATVRDALHAAIAGATARWSSSDTTVAAVTASGRVAARGNGTATVRAMVDRDTALVTVTVAQALAHWTLEPAALRLDALTATATAAATGRDARGNAIAGLAPSAWSVGDPTVLSVSAAGQVTALRNGATFLVATRGAVRDSVPVTVAQRAKRVAVTPRPAPALTSLGAQLQLVARAFDSLGVEILASQPAWFTPDPALARVSDGLVTALATGTARVVASLDAAADTATVVISNDPASVAISPDSALATSPGDTLVFRGLARNGRGDSVATTLAWRTPDSTVVRVLSDGRAVALAVGTARVIVTAGSRADTGLARVSNVPVSIDITPTTRLYTSLGDVDTLPVTIANARGAELPRGAVTWASDDPSIARVSAGGIVTARDTGQTVVRATSGSVTDSVLVTVQNLPASVAIGGPAVDTLTAVGQSLTLTVDVRNARGAAIPNYPVAWSSSNRTTVDTVLPTGVAVAVGWGTTSLVARAGAVQASMSLTARNPTVVYVSNAVYPAPRVGTLARPYAKIQDGVDAADAGDTVLVLRGMGRYAESVNLVRRIVLLGDSAYFATHTRNTADLPLLSHDTGGYAIRAHTTAPVAIKYLAIVHTLDGPAIDADGSDVQVEWVVVNPAGAVTSPVGRGISIANSATGSSVSFSRIHSVLGYGIRFYHVVGGSASQDSVDLVLAAPDGTDGSGIRATGGGLDLWGDVVRRTYGPMVHADSVVNFRVQASDFSGVGAMVRLVDATAAATIQNNVFRLDWVPINPNLGLDRPAAIQVIRGSGKVAVANNAFSGGFEPCTHPFCTVASEDWISVQDLVSHTATWSSFVEVNRNTFHSGQVVITSQNAIVTTFQNRADSVASFYRALGSDTLASGSDTVHATLGPCIDATGATSTQFVGGSYQLNNAVLDHCALDRGSAAVEVDASATGSGGRALVKLVGVRVSETNQNTAAVWVRGGSLTIDSSTFTGGTNPGLTQTDACTPLSCAGVRADAGDNVVDIRNSVISGFHRLAGLAVEHSTALAIQGNVIRGNRFGLLVDGVAVSAAGGAVVNDVFDNDSAGVYYTGFVPKTLSDAIWWGDGRGPRGAANPSATGDTVLSQNGAAVTLTAAATPGHTGTTAAALRAVRGNVQTAPAGTTLAKAFTVRVVDANGLPVAGVSVQFSVTGGGGNLGGQTTVTVVSNGSGLAEATLTTGTAPGVNTVRVSAGGVPVITFTATGT
jgi:hypothetical protein